MMLKMGNRGADVAQAQGMLAASGFYHGRVDGRFGPQTKEAVCRFQGSCGLPETGEILETEWVQMCIKAGIVAETEESNAGGRRHQIVKAPADKYLDGYSSFRLRDDVAAAYKHVYDLVCAVGGIIPSSGGLRDLNATVGTGRSSTSFHYLGLALDLHVGSAMRNPEKDPLVYLEQSDGFDVFARASLPTAVNSNYVNSGQALVWRTGSLLLNEVSGLFVNLTHLFRGVGFVPIPPRAGWPKTYLDGEWWHFQFTKGLVEGKSTFGEELLKIYTEEQLEGTPPWSCRDYVFYGSGWARR